MTVPVTFEVSASPDEEASVKPAVRYVEVVPRVGDSVMLDSKDKAVFFVHAVLHVYSKSGNTPRITVYIGLGPAQ